VKADSPFLHWNGRRAQAELATDETMLVNTVAACNRNLPQKIFDHEVREFPERMKSALGTPRRRSEIRLINIHSIELATAVDASTLVAQLEKLARRGLSLRAS